MTSEPRLRAIHLRDFKSVSDQSVDLGPLTAVVGANSAGKSTLLQAILALAQAVRSEANTPDFPLNGPLIRLGTFDETRNYLSKVPDRRFEVTFELLDDTPLPRPSQLFDDEDFDLDGDVESDKLRRRVIAWHAYVEPVQSDGRAGERGFAQIERLVLSVMNYDDDGSAGELAYACDLQPLADETDAAKDIGALSVIGGHRLGVRLRPLAVQGRVQDYVTGAPPRLDAVALSGGVPHAFLEKTTRLDHLAGLWWSIAASMLEEVSPPDSGSEDALIVDDLDRPDTSARVVVAQDRAAEQIRELVTGAEEDELPAIARRRWFMRSADRFFLTELSRLLSRLTQSEQVGLRESLSLQGEATFRSALRDRLSDLEDLGEPVLLAHSGPAVDLLTRSGRVAQRFFSSSIRYLGPLREAPNVLYDPGPGQTDLGPKGEYAAAVLHAQSASPVSMPKVPDAAPGSVARVLPLNAALNVWLSWFGLADRATAEDRGRLGIGLSVTPSALGRPVDLTSVGVGVSQVLPVILVCLLARPGTLVVLEQPELHLHPRLQQDLADFFLACVESGRQIVLETHSEHLVNRLRRRVAGDDTDATRALVKLVFAENTDGITSYRESGINTYGGLSDDWPDGFLDLGARESRALIKNSAAKRRREIADEPR